jgi:hypothetical protein
MRIIFCDNKRRCWKIEISNFDCSLEELILNLRMQFNLK